MARTTIKQVAKEAGVSTATISRVLTGSGFVSEEVKARVLEAVEKLNYHPNAVARSLKQDKTHTIGVIIPDISNPFFMSVLRGVEDRVQSHGYNLIICSSEEKPGKEQELLQLLQAKRVDAMVLVTAGRNDDRIADLFGTGFPIVLLDRQIRGSEETDSGFDLVAEDNLAGAYALTRRLLDMGHRKIAVINGFLDVSTGRDRYEGYLTAMRAAGLPLSEACVYDGEFSVEGGERAVAHFMACTQRPTAILSFNNNMTFGALKALTKLGLRVPKDVTIASYGQVEAAELLNDPGILCIKQFPYEMGQKVGEGLLAKLNNNRDGTMPYRYIFKPQVDQI